MSLHLSYPGQIKYPSVLDNEDTKSNGIIESVESNTPKISYSDLKKQLKERFSSSQTPSSNNIKVCE